MCKVVGYFMSLSTVSWYKLVCQFIAHFKYKLVKETFAKFLLQEIKDSILLGAVYPINVFAQTSTFVNEVEGSRNLIHHLFLYILVKIESLSKSTGVLLS